MWGVVLDEEPTDLENGGWSMSINLLVTEW
jgi:hypothetical protein